MPDDAREPTAPHRIDLPCAWYADEMRQDTSWIWPFTYDQIAEIDAALHHSKRKGLAEQEVRKEDFPLPTFAAVIDRLLDELESGRGLVLMRGFPVDRYEYADLRRIYWGLGTHMGRTMSQNINGEHMQEVRDHGFDYSKSEHRGSMTKALLRPHCDICDVVGLFCIRPAKSGGESTVCSSMTLYNEIFDQHPEYLDILHRGFRFDLDGKGPTGHPKEVTNLIPVYSWFQGQLSCRYNQKAIEEGAQKIDESLSPLEQEAVDFIGRNAKRPDVELSMDFRKGDIQWLNNYVILHSRNGFEDWPEPERRRLLLRLWVNHYKGRPLDDDFANKTLMGPRVGVKKRPPAYKPEDVKPV